MRVRECSNARFIVITSHEEVHLGCGSGISSVAGENKNLIVILVFLPIVHHGRHPELLSYKE